jgi:hypothetical protein
MSRCTLIAVAAIALITVSAPVSASAAAPPSSPMTWTQTVLSTWGVEGVSCPNTTDCYAVGSDGLNHAAIWSTSDGATTWTSATVPATAENLFAISCSAATRCMAVGRAGTVLITTNGTSWSQRDESEGDNIYGVSCPARRFCVAVGQGMATTTNFGQTWSRTSTGSVSYFNAVSCPSTSFCAAAADAAIWTTTNKGTTWNNETIPSGGGGRGISCPEVNRCIVVAIDGDVTHTKNGTTWTLTGQTGGDAAESEFGVDCYGISACVATGINGPSGQHVNVATTRNFGRAWSDDVTTYSVEGMGVSCPSATFCVVAADGAGGGFVLVGRG